eukprot:12903589-Prorocentrum_lima.AAC.1
MMFYQACSTCLAQWEQILICPEAPQTAPREVCQIPPGMTRASSQAPLTAAPACPGCHRRTM